MAQILLTSNPKKRRKHRRKARAHSRRKVRLSHAPRRRRRKSRAAVALRSNPRRRSRTRTVTLRRKSRRSNPSFRGLVGGVVPTLKAGFKGAIGAIGTDLAWGYGSPYLPASLQTGLPMYAAKLLAALAVGAVANKVKPGSGRDLAVGGTTVVLHDALRAQLQEFLPNLNLGAYVGFAPIVGVAQNAIRSIPTTRGVNGLGLYIPRQSLAGVGEMYPQPSYDYQNGIM